MYQFWQVLCLMLTVIVAMLAYEKGIRPTTSETVVLPQETIEQMIEKEVL
jgi:hypothetical protein